MTPSSSRKTIPGKWNLVIINTSRKTMPGKWDELSYDKLHNLGVVIIIYRILWQSQHIIPNPIAGEYRWMIKPSNLHIISTSDTDANNVDTETKIGACLTPYHEDITTIACVDKTDDAWWRRGSTIPGCYKCRAVETACGWCGDHQSNHEGSTV